jgi:hypothetical protein
MVKTVQQVLASCLARCKSAQQSLAESRAS